MQDVLAEWLPGGLAGVAVIDVNHPSKAVSRIAAEGFPAAKHFPGVDLRGKKELTPAEVAALPVKLSVATQWAIQSGEAALRHMHLESFGGVGCYASHVALLTAFAAGGAAAAGFESGPGEWLLVLETDATLRSNWRDTMAVVTATPLPALEQCPAILRLSHFGVYIGESYGQPIQGHPGLQSVVSPCGDGAAYLVRRSAAGAVVQALQSADCHVDLAMAAAAIMGRTPPLWLISPAPMMQRREGTTIQPKIASITKNLLPRSASAINALIIMPWAIAAALCLFLIVIGMYNVLAPRGRLSSN